METLATPSNRLIGSLLIIGVILVLVPYTALTIIFNYPVILRQESGAVLTQFHQAGTTLIAVWWLFAMGGFPLLIAYVLIGQKLENRIYFVRWATTLGVISGLVQIIGLLRWPFVVPILAQQYVSTTEPTTRHAIAIVFDAVHQYGGVVLGEHLGQLLTIIYTILLSAAFGQLRMMPRWVIYLGYLASVIYLLAQGELFATVIPGFPVWDLAGLIGSTLWLIWLFAVGVRFRRLTDYNNEQEISTAVIDQTL